MESKKNLRFQKGNTKNHEFRLARFILIAVLILFLNCLSGCRNYYKVTTEYDVTSNQITELKEDQQYIILHSNNNAWHFQSLLIHEDTITGILSQHLGNHKYYITHKPKGVNRYKVKHKQEVLNEVHLYTSDSISNATISISLPISSIEKLEINDPAHGSTIASWVAPVAIPVAIIGIAGATSSCPFIYINNGEHYAFMGEIYAGATCQPLERHDYLPLSGFSPVNGQYQLKISNELKERQHTNLAELLLIQHPENAEVLMDKDGNIHTLFSQQTPTLANSLNCNDYTQLVTTKDNNYFLFNEDSTENTLNNLVLTFKNYENSETGKLVVNAKNSIWADYAYGKFTELFGTFYPKWESKQNRYSTKKQTRRIMKQDIPLSVYLETDKGWEFVDFYHVVGPFAAKDMVMSIDLSKAKSKDVRIKLESGFMFWELDYAAMDFSKNVPVEKTILKINSAIDENGNDVANLLLEDDSHYLNQLNIGNEVIVKYDVPADKTSIGQYSKQTVIFHSKGYYEKICNYEGKPQWSELVSMRHPHSFSKFSWVEYNKLGKKYGLASMENDTGTEK